MATKLKTTKEKLTEITFVKKAFGIDTEVKVNLTDKELPVTRNEKGNLILGIPSKFFKSETATAEESKIALLEYKNEILESTIDSCNAKIKAAGESILENNDEIEQITTGKPSKKALDREEKKLMAKLEEIQKKKAAM